MSRVALDRYRKPNGIDARPTVRPSMTADEPTPATGQERIVFAKPGELVVKRSDRANGVETVDRLDGAVVVRLPPNAYDALEEECEPWQSIEDRVAEITSLFVGL